MRISPASLAVIDESAPGLTYPATTAGSCSEPDPFVEALVRDHDLKILLEIVKTWVGPRPHGFIDENAAEGRDSPERSPTASRFYASRRAWPPPTVANDVRLFAGCPFATIVSLA